MATILGANTLSSGFDVANSCRFNDGDSACMHKTPSSSGNRRTFTFSTWVKKTNDLTSNVYNDLYSAYDDANNISRILFWDSNALTLSNKVSGSFPTFIRTNRLFKDPTAWYHLVIAVDTTDGTEANRVKIYVNGIQETSLESSNYPSQNEDFFFNHTNEHNVGQQGDDDSALYFEAYLSETVMIDGLQLAPTSFGEFDEDTPKTWKPIDVSGLTFGTNGFYLDYEDSSNLGNDKSGGTDFTEVNLAAADQATDTCTNNFCTLNPLVRTDQITFSEGNCKWSNHASNDDTGGGIGTFGVTKGKWYLEAKLITIGGGAFMGIADVDEIAQEYNGDFSLGVGTYQYAVKTNGQKRNNDVDSAFGNSFTSGDIMSIAMDLDNQKIYFGKNGTWEDSGDPTSGATGTGSAFDLESGLPYSPAFSSLSSAHWAINTGEGWFGGTQISSANSDGAGLGQMEYSVPSGYYTMCTKNLKTYG